MNAACNKYNVWTDRISWLLALVFLLSTSQAFCEAAVDVSHAPAYTNKIVIVYNNGVPPMKFTNADGGADGILIDLWRLWSKKTGVEVEFREADWDQAQQMILTGRADLHAGMFYTEKRDQQFDFTASLLDVEYHIFLHKTVLDVDEVSDLMGFRIGVPKGYTQRYTAQTLPDAALGIFEGFVSLYEAALRGELRAFVSPSVNLRFFLKQQALSSPFRTLSETPFYQKQYHGVVREGNSGLQQLVNEGMARITAEERVAIERKWLGRAQTDTKAIDTIALDRVMPPFSMFDDEGQPAGLLVDLWRLWADKNGHRVQFRLTDQKRIEHDLGKGKADFSGGLVLPNQLAARLQRPGPLFSVPVMLYVRNQDRNRRGLDTFSDDRIGYFIHNQRQRLEQWVDAARLVEYENADALIHAMGRGDIRAFVSDRMSGDYALLSSGMIGAYSPLPTPLFMHDSFAGVEQGKHELLQQVQVGLDQISAEEKAAIVRRWTVSVPEEPLPETVPEVPLTAAERAWLKQHPVIDIGVDGKWPPIDFMAQDGMHSGIASDFLKALEKRLGIQLRPRPGPTFQQMLNRVRSGELKLGTTIVKTEERETDLLFTEPYYAARKVIAARRDSEGMASLEGLKGKTLAIEQGYYMVGLLQKQYPEIRLLEYDSTRDALEAVSWEQADAYIGNQAVIFWEIQQQQFPNLKIVGESGFPPSRQRFAVYRDEAWLPLASIIDKALATISEKERSAIYRKWLLAEDEKVARIELSEEEKSWLEAHPKIRLGVDPAWPPVEFVSAQGEYQGITSDYMDYLSRALNVGLVPQTGLSWSEMMAQAETGEIDLIPGLVKTEKRSQFFNFTRPYLSFPLVIFTRQDAGFISGLDDLAGKRVVVEQSYASQEHLEQDYPELPLILASDTNTALQMLSLGQVDAYMGSLMVASNVISQQGYTNLKVAAPTPYRFDLSIGVRKDWPELIPILQKALDSLTPDEITAIRQRWLALRYDVGVDYRLVWKVIAGALLLLFMGLFWSLTLRRQREAVRQSEARLRAIFEASKSVSFIIVNDEAVPKITEFSPGAEVQFGYLKQEVIGQPATRLYRNEDAAEIDANLRLLHEQHKPLSGEALLVRKNNEVFPVLYSLYPMVSSDGTYNGTLSVSIDICNLKQAQRELKKAKLKAEEASRFKSQFLANMSHEIRTPMNAVIGMSYLALQSGLTPRQYDYVNKISVSAHSLLNVINDILDFSKIEEGRLSIEITSFKLDEVMENLANLVTMKAEEKGIEILFSRDPGLACRLRGDPLRLGQVLTNLTQNAIKFTEQGEILVSARRLESDDDRIKVRFTVRDSGIGIEEEKIATLFDAFTQADGSTTRKYGGTGLGLSISKQLVGLMGGQISVDSTLGKGSTFAFTLSFERSIECIEQSPPLNLDLAGLKVLVVDDNASARQVLQEMLESYSFKVTLAASGQEALSRLEAGQHYDLVLMDWRMPGMDGIETSRRIKSNETLAHVPTIIMVTAYGRDEVMQQTDQVGLEGFLIKPVSPSLLFDTIVRAFSSEKRITSNTLLMQQQRIRQRLKGKVLLVEDHPINLQVARELLEGFGLILGIAGNGREAVEAVQQTHYDLVLMDIQMPEMDGFEATCLIREDGRFADLPIVAMTAHAMAGDRERCLEKGMNEHLAKPIDPDGLYRMLCKWLESSDMNNQPQLPTSEPVADEVELPESLPGIDLQWGLQRVGGNRALFRKLLNEFYQRHRNELDEIQQAISQGDRETARRLVHTLQGVSGNIGARKLEAAAVEVEAALINQRFGEHDSLPPVFITAFEELFQSLAIFCDESSSKMGQQPMRERDSQGQAANIEDLLSSLSIMLEEGDVAALGVLDQLQHELGNRAPLEQLNQLREEIEAYDFDQAAQILRTLIDAV